MNAYISALDLMEDNIMQTHALNRVQGAKCNKSEQLGTNEGVNNNYYISDLANLLNIASKSRHPFCKIEICHYMF